MAETYQFHFGDVFGGDSEDEIEDGEDLELAEIDVVEEEIQNEFEIVCIFLELDHKVAITDKKKELLIAV